MTTEPFATPTTAQPSPGLATGEGHFYSDGFRPGDFKFCYGVLADLLARNPGWHLADGAVALQDGSIPPDLRDRFIIGAGLTYALGAAGGAAGAPAHTHAFTQPDAHTITQPIIATHAALTSHAHDIPFAKTGGGAGALYIIPSGVYGVDTAPGGVVTESQITPVSSGGIAVFPMLTSSVSGGTPSAHTLSTNVALSNNHSGGAVGAVSGGGTGLPPYAALYILVKVS